MINILVMKQDTNNSIDIIRTKFNGTIETAKKYYNDSIVAETKSNTILKTFELLIFNGYEIKRLDTKYYSRFLINEIEFDLNRLHDLGQLLGVYTNSDNTRNCFTLNYYNNNFKSLIDNSFFKNLEIERNFYELLFDINCTNEIIDKTKVGYTQTIDTTKRMHTSGIFTTYKY